MSIRAIGSVCPRAILAMSVMLFTSGTLCLTNVWLINCNNTLSCSELNGEYADKDFRSLRSIVFEIYSCKVEKLLIFQNSDLRPSMTRSNIDLGTKNALPIVSTHPEQSAVFSVVLEFRTQQNI